MSKRRKQVLGIEQMTLGEEPGQQSPAPSSTDRGVQSTPASSPEFHKIERIQRREMATPEERQAIAIFLRLGRSYEQARGRRDWDRAIEVEQTMVREMPTAPESIMPDWLYIKGRNSVRIQRGEELLNV